MVCARARAGYDIAILRWKLQWIFKVLIPFCPEWSQLLPFLFVLVQAIARALMPQRDTSRGLLGRWRHHADFGSHKKVTKSHISCNTTESTRGKSSRGVWGENKFHARASVSADTCCGFSSLAGNSRSSIWNCFHTAVIICSGKFSKKRIWPETFLFAETTPKLFVTEQ